jgi:hypothetical protein
VCRLSPGAAVNLIAPAIYGNARAPVRFCSFTTARRSELGGDPDTGPAEFATMPFFPHAGGSRSDPRCERQESDP